MTTHKEEIKLQEAIIMLHDYKEEKGIEKLVELYKTTKNETLKDHAGILMFHNLFWKDEFKMIHDLNLKDTYENNPAYGQVSMIYNQHKKTHEFLDPEVSYESDYSVSGAPLLNVIIKNKAYKFWLDLGASMSVISEDVIKTCGLEDYLVGNKDSEEDLDFLVLDEIQVANLRVKNNAFIVLPSAYTKIPVADSDEIIEMHGVIGWDIIKYFDLTIKYDENTFVFKKPVLSDLKEKNILFDAFLVVRTHYTNKEILMSFDLEKEKTAMTSYFFQENDLESIDEKTEIMTYRGMIETDAAYVEALTLGIAGKVFELENVWDTAVNPCEIYGVEGIIGNDILTKGVLNIDVTNRHFSLL